MEHQGALCTVSATSCESETITKQKIIQTNVRSTYTSDVCRVCVEPYWLPSMFYLREAEEERGW